VRKEDFVELALAQMEDIIAYARRLARSAVDADDLLRTTYERAFSRWRELRDPKACRVWLFRIARNFYLDRARAVGARSELRRVGADDRVAPEPFLAAEAVERIEAPHPRVVPGPAARGAARSGLALRSLGDSSIRDRRDHGRSDRNLSIPHRTRTGAAPCHLDRNCGRKDWRW
jgi:RNA polymerase sigma-70 factor (ECF subfamily)